MGNTNIPGSLWAHPNGQLRYKVAIDKPNMWHHPLSTYKAGASIAYGQPVSISEPGIIVPTDPLTHSWCLGIALESGDDHSDVHILSHGHLQFDDNLWTADDIGKTVYIDSGGNFTLSKSVISIGIVVDLNCIEIVLSSDDGTGDSLGSFIARVEQESIDRDNDLSGRLNNAINNFNNQINLETQYRIANDDQITANLQNETARLDGRIDTVDARVTTEVNNRTTAINTVNNRITTEVNRLDGRIDTESSTRQSQFNDLSDEIARVDGRVTTESGRLDGRIDTERDASIQRDQGLLSGIDDLNSEVTRIDDRLENFITESNETNERQDNRLDEQRDFSHELQSTMENIRYSLNSRIDSTDNRITTETTRLDGRIDAESLLREHGDTSLSLTIREVEQILNSRIDTESDDRTVQDNLLDTRLTTHINNMNNRVDSDILNARDRLELMGLHLNDRPQDVTEGDGVYVLGFWRQHDSIINNQLRWHRISSNIPGEFLTVTFDSRGGSHVTPSLVFSGTILTPPVDPIRTDFTFMGWHTSYEVITDEDDDEEIENWGPLFDFSNPIVESMILFARWQTFFFE